MKKTKQSKKTKKGVATYQQQQAENREILRMLLRHRMKFQDVRIATDNQLGKKANGKLQNVKQKVRKEEDVEMLGKISKANMEQENIIEKYLDGVLKRFLIYPWLKEIKGCSVIASAWICGEIDIFIADTVSKIWQFAGFNPGMIKGKKSIKKKDYKPEMGEIIGELSPTKDGEKRFNVLTDELVRGDRKTPGFLCPYNSRLKTALIGILAEGFIKGQSPYALNHYYPYKNRIENSDQMTNEIKKGGKVIELPWKETKKNHRHYAAKRKMIKEFLKDLYVEWRTLEGLSIRKPYAEEYLGRKHHKVAG